MPIRIKSSDPAFDAVPAAVREWLEVSSVSIPDGSGSIRAVTGGRSKSVSLSEQALALNGAAYFESDIDSALDTFLNAPLPDGSLFGSFGPLTTPQTSSSFPLAFSDDMRGLHFEREPLDAQVESRAVLAALRVWQATGNMGWLQSRLPVLQRVLEYVFSHPARWSQDMELPKRAFTLGSTALQFREKPRDSATPPSAQPIKWCVHPGDAALLFGACQALAAMCEAAGTATGRAEVWRERAGHIEAQTNSIGWNGTYYSHQVHLDPVRVRGVDEARQLAACNVDAMTSGLASQEQCASILKEYQRRRELNAESSFAEWWSIQPPFPEAAFGLAEGRAANGGLWPRVGADLAYAAFEHGFEAYGVETLRRLYELAVKDKRLFASYLPDGSPVREADPSLPYGSTSHDAAGAASLMRALVEGLCGVRDHSSAFSRVTLAPRWPATGMATAEVEISYAASPAYVNYRWALDGGRMTLDYESQAKHIDFHILLPRGNAPERVALNGKTHSYALVTIEKSKYVDISTDRKRGTVAITLK